MEFIVIHCEAWMNAHGHGFNYYAPSGRRHRLHVAAVREGLRTRGSDDFQIGRLDRGRLTALMWMDEVVDDEPGVLAEVAAQVLA